MHEIAPLLPCAYPLCDCGDLDPKLCAGRRAPDPAEAMRAKDREIAALQAEIDRMRNVSFGQFIVDERREAAEATRAKCEEIADGMAVSHSGMGPIEMRRKIRDAIAALKRNDRVYPAREETA